MAKRDLPTPEELRQLLRCEPESGLLFWRPRPVEMFRSLRAAAVFNGNFAGKEALYWRNHNGYPAGAINGRHFLAHRVIWAMCHGEWPLQEIDHINGVRHDNRLRNLRAVDRVVNSQNLCIRSDNTSGVVGVWWSPRHDKWQARIYVQGKRHHLGIFERLEDAAAARKSAEVKYGFHRNHGRPSPS